MTNPNYQVYNGVDFTATKRFSNSWQMQAALTMQNNPQYFPDGSPTLHQPDRAGIHGTASARSRSWIWQASGSYPFPWDITASANFNFDPGARYGTHDDQRSRGRLRRRQRRRRGDDDQLRHARSWSRAGPRGSRR